MTDEEIEAAGRQVHAEQIADQEDGASTAGSDRTADVPEAAAVPTAPKMQ